MGKIKVALTLMVGLALSSTAHAGALEAIDLGSLASGQYFWTEAAAINDAGQVTGTSISLDTDHYRAFITDSNGVGMQDIGILWGGDSWGIGINKNGQVVGTAQTSSGSYTAFVTGSNGSAMSEIDSSFGPGSGAFGINDTGQVVGGYRTSGSTNPSQLFMTVFEGGSSVAWGLGFSFHSAGNAINSTGKVVGFGDDSRGGSGPNYVVVGGPDPRVDFTKLWAGQAYDINDSDQMVGEAFRSGNRGMHAFIANVNDTDWVDLGTLGGDSSRARAINNSGHVVGASLTADGNEHAFVWDPINGMRDLNILVPLPYPYYFTEARDINNSGQIIANANNNHAYLIMESTTVVDITPPTISDVSANPSILRPPNKKMVDVTVNYTAADDYTPSLDIVRTLDVTSNEPIIKGSDYQIVDAHHVRLRSVRLGKGPGRIYTINITCADTVGNSSSKSITVTVP